MNNRAKGKQLKSIEQNREREKVFLEERTDRAPTTIKEPGQNGLADPH
jgi:hypothetical protein